MKTFLLIDKSGRGFTGQFTEEQLLTFEDETSNDDVSLHEWVGESEQGDEWEDNSQKIICNGGGIVTGKQIGRAHV